MDDFQPSGSSGAQFFFFDENFHHDNPQDLTILDEADARRGILNEAGARQWDEDVASEKHLLEETFTSNFESDPQSPGLSSEPSTAAARNEERLFAFDENLRDRPQEIAETQEAEIRSNWLDEGGTRMREAGAAERAFREEATVRKSEVGVSQGDEIAPEHTSARLDRAFRENGRGRRILRSKSSQLVGDYPLEEFVEDLSWLGQENPTLFLQNSFQPGRFGLPGDQDSQLDSESTETRLQASGEETLPPQRRHERRGLTVQFPVDLSALLHVEKTCSICLQPLERHASVADSKDWQTSHAAVMIKCGHMFGGCCLSTWIYDTLKQNCPMCRTHLVQHPNVDYDDGDGDEYGDIWDDEGDDWDEVEAMDGFDNYFQEISAHHDHWDIGELQYQLDVRHLFPISPERLQRESIEVFFALASSDIDACTGIWSRSAEYRERARMIMRAMAIDMKCDRDLVGLRLLDASFEPYENEAKLSRAYTDEKQLVANVIILISNFKEMTELWLKNGGLRPGPKLLTLEELSTPAWFQSVADRSFRRRWILEATAVVEAVKKIESREMIPQRATRFRRLLLNRIKLVDRSYYNYVLVPLFVKDRQDEECKTAQRLQKKIIYAHKMLLGVLEKRNPRRERKKGKKRN